MITRRTLLAAGGASVGVALLPRWAWTAANAAPAAAAGVTQTGTPAGWIPQFEEPLPSIPVTTKTTLRLQMAEFDCHVLPASMAVPPTRVWGYRDLDVAPPALPDTYLGPIVLATRGVPTEVTYVNDLGDTSTSQLRFWQQATDKTLHWANPLDEPMVDGDTSHYSGPIPAVPHLHGGEVPAALDGGPGAWFTSDGRYTGPSFYGGGATQANAVRYRYPNSQQAALIWFHDHTLGLTRINVYAGLAGAYLLVDPNQKLPLGLPGPADAVPLVIQDRMFDTEGQWLFPNRGETHPYWLPEFMGDTVLVNGRPWPYKKVEAKRYRFLVLNGSNARAYNLSLVDRLNGIAGPPMWVIGTDGGYLDTPVKLDPTATAGPSSLLVMPGERYDVMVDFADPDFLRRDPRFAGKLVLRNDANAPYPDGDPVTAGTTDTVMEFRVGRATTDPTKIWDPAAKGATLRATGQRIVRLADPVTGTLAFGAQVDRTRQLTLNEVTDANDSPIEVLVNNSRFDPPATETPLEGTTELWELINLTADAHPIHLHLVQFQLLNRQAFDDVAYAAVYGAAFPGGAFLPAAGPPAAYDKRNKAGAVGGNPDVTPYLNAALQPPFAYEAGWKDTVMVRPREVTRLLVRFTPVEVGTGSKTGAYPFDPSLGDGYVWHCHIIDHEDNEMMRPLSVAAAPKVKRTYRPGIEY